jgi:serine phosphatase RsbU (regulator of sigma subunit)
MANGNFCILIGDVSGKGMNAAFYMAQLKGVVLSVAKRSNYCF